MSLSKYIVCLCHPFSSTVPIPEKQPGGGVLRLAADREQLTLEAVSEGVCFHAAAGAVDRHPALPTLQARGRGGLVAVVAQHVPELAVQYRRVWKAVEDDTSFFHPHCTNLLSLPLYRLTN